MPGKIKQLTFSDGANVSAPADFPTITTSGLVSYATDADFVTGKGSAASAGDVYFDTTLRVVKEHNGTAWCVVLAANGLTASRALATDGSSIPVASATTATELGYVSGVTSAIQTQLNAKQATGSYVTSLTGDVTASGPGAAAATVVSVGGSTATNVHNAELLANAATNANTASAIVKRDPSGNFSAGTITATLSGNASTATTATTASTVTTNANLTGPVTSVGNATAIADGAIALAKLATTTAGFIPIGAAITGIPTYVAMSGDTTITSTGVVAIGAGKVTNAQLAGSIDLTAKVTGSLPLANGGTGGTTAVTGLNNLLPSQTGNSGKVLGTDGSNASWVAGLTTSLASANFFIGNGSNVATATAISGDITVTNAGVAALAATLSGNKTLSDSNLTLTETTANKQLKVTQSGASTGTTNAPICALLTNTSSSGSPAGYFESSSDSGEGALRVRLKHSRSGGSNTLVVEGDGSGGNLIYAQNNAETTPVQVFNVDGNGATTMGASGGTQSHTANGSLSITKALTVGTVLTATVTQNSSISGPFEAMAVTSSCIQLTGNAAITINGIVAPASDGVILIIENHTNHNLTINNDNASTAINGIVTSSGIAKTVAFGAACWMFYSNTRWRLFVSG